MKQSATKSSYAGSLNANGLLILIHPNSKGDPCSSHRRTYDYDVDGTTMPVQTDPEGDEFIEFTHEGLGDWD